MMRTVFGVQRSSAAVAFAQSAEAFIRASASPGDLGTGTGGSSAWNQAGGRLAADGLPPDRPWASPRAEGYRGDVRERCREAFGEDADDHADAIERYAMAVELARSVYDSWVEVGCPSTTSGGASGKTLVEHPLVAAIIKSSVTAAKLEGQLGVPRATRRLALDGFVERCGLPIASRHTDRSDSVASG